MDDTGSECRVEAKKENCLFQRQSFSESPAPHHTPPPPFSLPIIRPSQLATVVVLLALIVPGSLLSFSGFHHPLPFSLIPRISWIGKSHTEPGQSVLKHTLRTTLRESPEGLIENNDFWALPQWFLSTKIWGQLILEESEDLSILGQEGLLVLSCSSHLMFPYLVNKEKQGAKRR